MMRIHIDQGLHIELDVYDLEESGVVAALAHRSHLDVYSWTTYGVDNWLQKGYHICNVLGLTLLPRGLPDVIVMDSDVVEDDSDCADA